MLARLHLPGMALATPAKEFETPAFDLPAMEPPRLGLPRFRVPTFALPRPFAPKPLISRRAMALGGLLLAAGAAAAVAGWALVRRHLLPPGGRTHGDGRSFADPAAPGSDRGPDPGRDDRRRGRARPGRAVRRIRRAVLSDRRAGGLAA